MRSQVPSFLRIHDSLKQAAENCRGDTAPVKITGIKEHGSHCGIKTCRREGISKEVAVHILKGRKLLGQIRQPFFRRGVEDIKEMV